MWMQHDGISYVAIFVLQAIINIICRLVSFNLSKDRPLSCWAVALDGLSLCCYHEIDEYNIEQYPSDLLFVCSRAWRYVRLKCCDMASPRGIANTSIYSPSIHASTRNLRFSKLRPHPKGAILEWGIKQLWKGKQEVALGTCLKSPRINRLNVITIRLGIYSTFHLSLFARMKTQIEAHLKTHNSGPWFGGKAHQDATASRETAEEAAKNCGPCIKSWFTDEIH